MSNQDTLLLTIVIFLGIIAYLVISDEYSWIYNHDRTFRKHKKKRGLVQKKTEKGWE
jgi:hypothetical protein